MTTQIPRDTVNDNEIVMRRVTRTGVTRDEDQGTTRPSSDAFLQGGPEGNVSVYLASETTPERITREFPDTYVALVEVSAIRAQGLEVEREPVEHDPGHCNITGRKTAAKRRAIARSARWAEEFAPT